MVEGAQRIDWGPPVTLRRALDSIPRDRASDAALRDVLGLLRKHAGEWVDQARLCGVIEEHRCVCTTMLDILVSAFVLDFDGDAGRYRMPSDRFLFLEIDGFLRRAGSQSHALQANVARFRGRFGAK